VRRTLLVALLLALLAAGCKGYSDHEREVYLLDAQKLLDQYQAIREMRPIGHGDTMRAVDAAKDSVGGFKRSYVATPVDKDFGLIAQFERVQEAASSYQRTHLTEALSAIVDQQTSVTEEDKERVAREFDNKLAETEAKIKGEPYTPPTPEASSLTQSTVALAESTPVDNARSSGVSLTGS
jgi:type VI protein secretion system component VasK